MRGAEVGYLQVDSAFGLTTTISWGRWVLSNVVLIGFLAVAAILSLALWASTGEGAALGAAFLFALLDIPAIAFFAWSITPQRTAAR